MQLTGTASVTNGSPNVTAAAGVDWSQATAASWFTVVGSNAVYLIASLPTFSGGVWHVVLTANYAGATNAAAATVIQKDFNANNVPIFAVGDTEILSFLNRWTAAIAAVLAGSGSGGTFDSIRLKNPTDNLYYTVSVEGAPGSVYPVISNTGTP